MSMFALVKTLKKIDKECKKDKELEKRLTPIVEEFNKKKPTTKTEAELISKKFIEEYNRIKSDIARGVNESNSLRKIEQINER